MTTDRVADIRHCPICNTPKPIDKIRLGIVYGICGHILGHVEPTPSSTTGGWD